MSDLSERKMEVFDVIDNFIESLVGSEFSSFASSDSDGDYKIIITIPKEAFCMKDGRDD